jgi:hypothetical protein
MEATLGFPGLSRQEDPQWVIEIVSYQEREHGDGSS